MNENFQSVDDLMTEADVAETNLAAEQVERLRADEAVARQMEAQGETAAEPVPETERQRLERLDAAHQAFRERLARGEIVKLGDLPPTIPEFANRNRLFKNGWLRKGGAAMLVSISGSGKSVMIMQMMCAWAVGKPTLGVEPLMPLRIGYFQAEDDEQDMAEQLAGVLLGLKDREGWTDEDVALAKANVDLLPPFVSDPGESFVRYVRHVQQERHFDLIVINPLQSFTGCDIQSNAEMTKFVRGGLDPIIKNPETACGLFIVHHTPKPPIDARTRSCFGLDEYGEYAGAGASELTNWLRAMLTLVPVPKHRGIFYLTGVKRDDRLGWPIPENLNWVKPRRIIAHTPGYLYWQTLGKLPDEEKAEDERPEVEIHAEILAKLIKKGKKGIAATDLRVKGTDEKGKSGKKLTKKQVDEAIKCLTAHAADYGVVVEHGDRNSKTFRKREENEVEQPALEGASVFPSGQEN